MRHCNIVAQTATTMHAMAGIRNILRLWLNLFKCFAFRVYGQGTVFLLAVAHYERRMRFIDLPPIWLVLFLAVTWISPWQVPWGAMAIPGLLIIFSGVLMTVAALVEFRRARTTVIPRQSPDALITSGIFRVSRNPIYLSDVLILLGFSLMWGKLLGFALVVVFAWMLERRFIRGEEARLRDAFGQKFEDYAAQTRRWI